MKVFQTTDLHLTDRPDDEYRWQYLEQFVPEHIKKHECQVLWILGDLTDKRDNHSATLVNRLVGALEHIFAETRINRIVILGGNHDKPLGGYAYCDFFEYLKGSVYYISSPLEIDGCLFLPYTKEPSSDWVKFFPIVRDYSAIAMHQAVEGVVGGAGHRIEADCRVELPKGMPIFSGHIHKPQFVGGVQYIGAPYHVHFGDDYIPQYVVFDSDSKTWERFETNWTQKHTVRFSDLEQLDALLANPIIKPIDHVKLVYQAPSGAVDIHEIEASSRAQAQACVPDGIIKFEVQTQTALDLSSSVTSQNGLALDISPEVVVKEYLAQNKKVHLEALALRILNSEIQSIDSADLAEVDRLSKE